VQLESSKATLLFRVAACQYPNVSVHLCPCPRLMRTKIPAGIKQMEDNFLSLCDASLCRPQTSPVPLPARCLPPSQPVAFSSDLSLLVKGLCCWPHVLLPPLHTRILVTWRAVQYFKLPSGRCSPETASQGPRAWRCFPFLSPSWGAVWL